MNHSLIMINSYPGLQTKERLLDTKVISSYVNEQNNCHCDVNVCLLLLLNM